LLGSESWFVWLPKWIKPLRTLLDETRCSLDRPNGTIDYWTLLSFTGHPIIFAWKELYLWYLHQYFMLKIFLLLELLAHFNMMTPLLSIMHHHHHHKSTRICLRISPRDMQLFLHFVLYEIGVGVVVRAVVVAKMLFLLLT
jgi:hypothetical protein